MTAVRGGYDDALILILKEREARLEGWPRVPWFETRSPKRVYARLRRAMAALLTMRFWTNRRSRSCGARPQGGARAGR
jgi:hypothetical protein